MKDLSLQFEGQNLEWLEPVPEGTAMSDTFPILPPGLFAVPVHVPELSTSLFRAPVRDPGLGQESSRSARARDKNQQEKRGAEGSGKGKKNGIRWKQEKGMGWEALNYTGIPPSFYSNIHF